MKVKDVNGVEIKNVYRGRNGALIVHDTTEYRKYLQAKRQAEDINNYKNDVDNLKADVKTIGEQVNNLAGEMAEVKNLLMNLTVSLTKRSQQD